MSKILDKLFSVASKLQNKYNYNKHYFHSKQRISKSLLNCKIKRNLSASQKEEVRSFYKQLTGKNVSLLYHEYFFSRTGKYSKEYMPIDLFEADIIGRANRWDYYIGSFRDKNFDEVYLPHIKHPHTYLKNINGYYYYEGNPVSREEAISLCKNLKNVVIKPSQLSKGKGVKKISVTNGKIENDEQTIEEIFDTYKKDFIIQEAIIQHEKLSALNPTSVNTMRVMTYRSGMEVLVVYAAIRIGRIGQVIDNQSAGGISTVINEDGTLGKYAFGVAGDDMIEKTDTGIILEGYQIPYFNEALDIVKQSHYDLPYFDIVGWDISIDKEGVPILVEWNGNPGPSQTACGTGLGKYTERIIKEVWPRVNSRFYV